LILFFDAYDSCFGKAIQFFFSLASKNLSIFILVFLLLSILYKNEKNSF